MRVKIFVLLVLIVTAAFSTMLYGGQADHPHKSPHGGIVQDAEGMHLEFLLDKSGEPKLFLYDKAMKPIERSDLEAKLTIKGHGGAEHTQALKFSKDAKEGPVFKGEPIKGLSDWDSALVRVKIKDEWKTIRFTRHSSGHGH